MGIETDKQIWFKYYAGYRIGRNAKGKKNKLHTQSYIAKNVGCKPQNIQAIIDISKNNCGSEGLRRKIVKIIGDNYENAYKIGTTLLNGDNPENLYTESETDKEHAQNTTFKKKHPPHNIIITLFEQQALAEEINWNLLELEKLDPSELNEINKFIKYRISEKEKEGKKNQGEGLLLPGHPKKDGTSGN